MKFIKSYNDKHGNPAILYEQNGAIFIKRSTGRQYDLNRTGISDLKQCIDEYYSLLKQIGVKVPPFYNTNVDGGFKLVEITTNYYKESLPEDANSNPKKWKRRLDQYENIIGSLYSNIDTESNLIKVSLDPNPSNFGLDDNDDLILIDFTPPMYIKNDEWSEFRRKDEMGQDSHWKINRYFSKDGFAINFLNRFIPIYMQYKNEIIAEFVENSIQNKYLNKETISMINSNSINDNRDLIINSNPSDRDRLRFIYLKFIARNQQNADSFYKKYKKPEIYREMKSVLTDCLNN